MKKQRLVLGNNEVINNNIQEVEWFKIKDDRIELVTRL